MESITKLFTILLMISPVFAYSAETIKAEGKARARIIEFTNENNIVDNAVKKMSNNKPVGNFDNTVVGIDVTKQDANVVNVAVTF